MRVETPTNVSESQLRTLVDAIGRSGNLTRDAIVHETTWARSTVSRVVGSLLDARLLVETDLPQSGGRGRPPTAISLNPTFGVAIGLDFGFRHVRGVLADAAHEIRSRAERELDLDYTVEGGCRAAAEVVDELLARADVPASRIVGIAAAVPAPVDLRTGVVSIGGVLPGWGGEDIRAHLSRALSTDTRIDNDTKMAAYGELRWGVGQGVSDFVYLKLHSGIGGAAVIDGRLVHGATGAAGQFGHMSIDTAGPLCRCGGRGCVEMHAGIPAILKALSAVHGEIGLHRALTLLDENDPACVRIVSEAALRVGEIAGSLCNALNPESIVIGGALAAAFEHLEPSLRRGIDATALPVNRATRIVQGRLGRDASAMGALGVALDYGLVGRLGI